MECKNKGLWHLGISDEACENAGGKWYRTPCLTLKETIDNRPSRFDLDNPLDGSCQDNLIRLETAVVSASTADSDFRFASTQNGCNEFCRSLPDYSQQIGMMTHSIESEDTLSYCTCIYRNDKLPSRDVMPSYSKPSPPKFTLTNSDGMALGLRPKVDCDATDDLMIETQVADANNLRQQFQITQDGQIVSVRCPKKVLTNVLGGGGTSCTDGAGLQLKEYGWIPSALTSSPTVSPGPTANPTVNPTANTTTRKCFKTKSELQEAVLDFLACSEAYSTDYCTARKAAYGSSINNWCFDGINDFSGLFKDTSFNEPIYGWDVSSVVNMEGMFEGATAFNQNIGRWKTERVTDMQKMFKGASAFNQDLSGWNTEKVTNMEQMFYSAISFNGNIENWAVSKVTTMEGMFINAQVFNQNIGSWDVSKVVNMIEMFNSALSFNGNIGNWKDKTGNVRNMGSMIAHAKAFNQPLNIWNVDSVTVMNGMFSGAEAFNQPLYNWNVGRVTNMLGMFTDAKAFNQNIGGWDVSKVERMDFMFQHASEFNQNIGAWNTDKVQNMMFMFDGASKFNQNIGSWNTEKVRHMAKMFKGASEFNQDLCPWGGKIPYDSVNEMFTGTSCPFKLNPSMGDTPNGRNPLNMCQRSICITNPTAYPTTNPTAYPTTNPTAYPTTNPTTNPKGEYVTAGINSVPLIYNYFSFTHPQDEYQEKEYESNFPVSKQTQDNHFTLSDHTDAETSLRLHNELQETEDQSNLLVKQTQDQTHHMSSNHYAGDLSDLQRWKFNDTDKISNVGCPNLAISSSKQKDVSLNSIYFALQNPRTQLAIGISEESCEDGMILTMQDLVYGNPNQQFVYSRVDKKIISVTCPEFALTIPSDDCNTTESILMSSEQNVGNRNKWLFKDDKDVIESINCPEKFITIHGASSGGARRLVTRSNNFLKERTQTTNSPSHSPKDPIGGPPEQEDDTKGPNATYNDEPPKGKTEWDPATPPSVGSTVILSDLNAERYQKWTKQRQLLHPLMGPFSVINPNNRQAMTVDDRTCSNGLSLSSSADDYTSIRQQFYLGQHGSIFSAHCPGLVLAAEDKTAGHSSVVLEIFQTNQKKLKWKFANGMVESVSNSGMVLASNPADKTMILKDNSTDSDNVNWIRMNTRLLSSNNAIPGWKQDWKVTFVDSEYKEPSVAEFIKRGTAMNAKCYNISSAFSASFDEFAKKLVVNDASDEDQCRKVREALGFDKDYPFDVEVRDKFHQQQCDPFFTGVDHTSGNDMEALSAPPKFEMVEYTPVEYEAVEYDEKEYATIDYEEFSKGDDLGELSETSWPDLYIPAAGLGDLT
eukprot:scaffold2838_cov23-Cyclotella_meneghiniana.AAC.2